MSSKSAWHKHTAAFDAPQDHSLMDPSRRTSIATGSRGLSTRKLSGTPGKVAGAGLRGKASRVGSGNAFPSGPQGSPRKKPPSKQYGKLHIIPSCVVALFLFPCHCLGCIPFEAKASNCALFRHPPASVSPKIPRRD